MKNLIAAATAATALLAGGFLAAQPAQADTSGTTAPTPSTTYCQTEHQLDCTWEAVNFHRGDGLFCQAYPLLVNVPVKCEPVWPFTEDNPLYVNDGSALIDKVTRLEDRNNAMWGRNANLRQRNHSLEWRNHHLRAELRRLRHRLSH